MALTATLETVCTVRWTDSDDRDVRNLFDKLFRYKKQAGFKSDGLDLDKTDRRIIKQFYDIWEHNTPPQNPPME